MKKTAIFLLFVLVLVLSACQVRIKTGEEDKEIPVAVPDRVDTESNKEGDEVIVPEGGFEWKIQETSKGKMYLVAPNECEGKIWEIPNNASNRVVEYSCESFKCLVYLEDEEGITGVWLADAIQENLILLSEEQVVVDCKVKDDILYWINADKEVWSYEWLYEDTIPVQYCDNIWDLIIPE